MFVTDCLQKYVGLSKSIEGESKRNLLFFDKPYSRKQSVTNLRSVLFFRGPKCWYINKERKNNEKRRYCCHVADYYIILADYRNRDKNFMTRMTLRHFSSIQNKSCLWLPKVHKAME